MQQRKQRNIRKSSGENNISPSNFPRKSTAEVLLDLDFEGMEFLIFTFLLACIYFCSISKTGIEFAEKEPETAGRTEEGSQHNHGKHETPLHVVIGLPCPEPGSSEIPGSNRSRPPVKKVHIDVDDQRQQICDFTSQTIKVGDKIERYNNIHIILRAD